MSKTNSDTNKQRTCDKCGISFKLKADLIKHLSMHSAQENVPRTDGLTCYECNIVFKNKGLLVCHNLRVHQPKSTPKGYKQNQGAITENKYRHICQACQINFFHMKDLKHHIREYHFNLLSHAPYCDFKKVNQVWFEKVLNSNNIVEIKKVAQNILLIRKLDDNTAMTVSDHATEVIDLRDVYPTLRSKAVQCLHCHKMYDKGYINKHVTDIHMKYNDKILPESS